MLHLRHHRGLFAGISGVVALGLLATACDTEPGQQVLEDNQFPPAVRIVEVLGAAPTGSSLAFVELRNDTILLKRNSALYWKVCVVKTP